MLLPEHKDFKLTINTTANIVSDSIIVNVSFENNTNSDFSLLNRNEVTISSNKSYTWNLKVLFEDTVRMISPIWFLSKIKKPTKKDYFLLKSGDRYTFNFIVDFNKLARIPLEFGTQNKNYGDYSLQLTYKDPFCIVKCAICEQIQSNTIKITYKK